MLNKKFLALIITYLCLLFLATPTTIIAQSSLFSDNFESGISDQWSIIKGDWYLQEILSSKRFGLVLNDEFKTAEVQAGSYSWDNYEFSFDMLPIQGWDRNIFFRVGNERSKIDTLDLPTGYALHMSPNWIDLQKWTPGLVRNPDILRVPASWDNNTIRHFRIILKDNNIKIYSNNHGDASPSSPLIDYTDNTSNPILSGKIALVITTGAAFPSEVWFDNILVTNIAQEPVLPSLNVSYLSQLDPLWGNDIYDSARQWSNNPFISRWGCALTSASMVLNYYGFGTTPKTFNEWLITQKDGYLNGGLLNWIAVSRFSNINKAVNTPVLEYRRLGNNPADLINELKNGSPPILKVFGHFIVAKSQLTNTFGINDPAYSNRVTLDSYDNTYLTMHTFHPTHTDLSYILLTIDSKNLLQVFDQDGNEIMDHSFIEEGLADDTDVLQAASNSIRIFQLPTPNKSNYLIKILGQSGKYNLNYYAYDEDANVNISNKSGVLFENTQDVFEINFDNNPSIKRIITIETLNNDLVGFYSQKQISKGVFRLIKARINFINWFLKMSKTKNAKMYLKYLHFQIQYLTPNFISKTASTVLLEDIKILLDSI